MYALILKTSEGAKKAWLTRQRNAQARTERLSGSVTQSLSGDKVAPSPRKSSPLNDAITENVMAPKSKKAAIAKMTEYMAGFSSKLKNQQEKDYTEERIAQMIAGTARPSGMSGKHGLTKQRAVQYEVLIFKIFKAGKAKHNV